ncbi:MAG: LLM class flavin-dependent oxidoreductase [bacterium]|nr:LLM class flavin-dependent oxidoreductase [Gammaproteobacteria bacterium]HIL96773.1 LLM class flavin-dependent oxidoreductase [Pseudomonadales bacterium]
MKLTIGVGDYRQVGIEETIGYIQFAEKLGIDSVWSAEAWSTDAVTSLAFIAARTSKIKLGSGIMQVGPRAPSMIAMTALSLNALSKGRFLLGLGASGPQVIEGLAGVSYDAPLTRLKETVEICRMAFAGKKLIYEGRHYVLPRRGGEGKALRLDFQPSVIPIYLATLGPRSLEYTGAAADGWLGTSFSPIHAEAHLDYIERGAKEVGRDLTHVDLSAAVTIGISDDVEGLIASRKPGLAFQIGAMGSADTNFYNQAFNRAGYVEDTKAVQALWLAGKRREAAQRIPDVMVNEFQALGTAEMVRERLINYQQAGITSLNLRLDTAKTMKERMALLEEIVDIVNGLPKIGH